MQVMKLTFETKVNCKPKGMTPSFGFCPTRTEASLLGSLPEQVRRNFSNKFIALGTNVVTSKTKEASQIRDNVILEALYTAYTRLDRFTARHLKRHDYRLVRHLRQAHRLFN